MPDAEAQPPAGLLARIRERLGARRRVPFVQQLSASECGAACLSMVLRFHGRRVAGDSLRDLTGSGRDATHLAALLAAAKHYGLEGEALRMELSDLALMPPATLLHWDFNHFVVFERLRHDGADIVDPAFGRRRVSMEELRRSFTGVALVLEPGEDFVREQRAPRRLLRHAGQVLRESRSLGRLAVTSLLLQVFALALPVLSGVVVDRVLPAKDMGLLGLFTLGLGAIIGFELLASLIRGHLLAHLRMRVDRRLTSHFLAHLISLPIGFFQRRSAGDLLMRLNSHTTIRETLTAGALSTLLDGVLVSLYVVLLFATSLSLGLLVLGLGAAQVGLYLLTRERQKEHTARQLEAQSHAQGYEVELFHGMETLKAGGFEQPALSVWRERFTAVAAASLARGKLEATIIALQGTLRLGAPLGILALGAHEVLTGSMSLGTMLAASALASGFLVPLASLVATAGQLDLLGGYLERVDDVLEARPEQDPTRVRPAPRLTGRIELESVSFRYSPLAPRVLEDVSLSIAPGQLVAIVGTSGSGKSTLAGVLLGLHVLEAGAVRYDGSDLRELELGSLRRQLGIVTQEGRLFARSIRENIALANPERPLEDVRAAARRACIAEEIEALPMGYDTQLGDGGSLLSGGQRQRVALARSLIDVPAILLLDEATSALDAVTEARVHEQLAALRCTRIVIAHRLSTISRADLILVMEGGRLVEQGTHEALLARGGTYARLVTAQLGTAVAGPQSPAAA